MFCFRFEVLVDGASNEDFEVEIEGTTSSSGYIIVVVCVFLALILVVTGALVFYAKKQEKWCFAPTQADLENSEDEKPLRNTDPNLPPIVKPGLRRPQS